MTIKKPIDFFDPEYYDISAVSEDTPNIPLLTNLFNRMNEQNERLWEFFTEMVESPDYKPMKASAIKPRQQRKKYKKRRAKMEAEKARRKGLSDDEESIGYKQFLKDEGFDDLLSPEDRDHTKSQTNGYKRLGRYAASKS